MCAVWPYQGRTRCSQDRSPVASWQSCRLIAGVDQDPVDARQLGRQPDQGGDRRAPQRGIDAAPIRRDQRPDLDRVALRRRQRGFGRTSSQTSASSPSMWLAWMPGHRPAMRQRDVVHVERRQARPLAPRGRAVRARRWSRGGPRRCCGCGGWSRSRVHGRQLDGAGDAAGAGSADDARRCLGLGGTGDEHKQGEERAAHGRDYGLQGVTMPICRFTGARPRPVAGEEQGPFVIW